MGDNKTSVFTRENLQKALENKRIPVAHFKAEYVASLITCNDLEHVQTGFRHDGRPVSFARGYEICYGERLTLSKRCG